MEEDKLSFLNSDKGADPAPEPAATPVQTPENSGSPGQPRDDSGRFAPKAADAPAPVPAAAAPTQQAQTPAPAAQPVPAPEPKHEAIPLPTALDWRDRMTVAEKRLKQIEAQQQQQPQQVPSPQDEQAYNAYWGDRLSQAEWQMTAKTSHRFAAKEHGADKVEEAAKWAFEANDPHLIQQFRAQEDPYGWLIARHRAHQVAERVGGKSFEDAAKEWALSNGFVTTGAAPAPEPQAPAPASPQPAAAPPTPAPPKSIVNQPGATGSLHTIPTGPGAAFAAVFDRS